MATKKAAPKKPKARKINWCEEADRLEQDLQHTLDDIWDFEDFIINNILPPIRELGQAMQDSDLDIDNRREKVVQWIEKSFNVTINSFR